MQLPPLGTRPALNVMMPALACPVQSPLGVLSMSPTCITLGGSSFQGESRSAIEAPPAPATTPSLWEGCLIHKGSGGESQQRVRVKPFPGENVGP